MWKRNNHNMVNSGANYSLNLCFANSWLSLSMALRATAWKASCCHGKHLTKGKILLCRISLSVVKAVSG